MTQHWEAVEADFASHYGIDLREACWGQNRMGVRRLLALLRGLPPSGAFHASLNPKTFGWTHTDELLVLVAELLDANNRLFIMANSKKGTKPPKPLHIPRPGQPDPIEERHVATSAEILSFFGHRQRQVNDGD